MDEQPSKRRGRPRKTVDIPDAVEEGEDATNVNTGDGQIGETGTPARTEPEGSRKAIGWLELVELVKDKTRHDYRISCVIHPDANGLVNTEHMGSIRTLIGEPGYQLDTGEIVHC